MAEISNFSAEAREWAGKGAARATRRLGRVPAVIYGDKKTPVMISVDPLELKKYIMRGGFFSHVYDVNVGGDKHRVIPRDVQLDPVSDRPIHIDFLRVNKDSRLAVDIPIHFLNEELSPGLKRGGVLNVVRHELELMVSPDNIPEFIEIDLDGLDIGDAVHISQVKLPEGVRPTIDRDYTVVTMAAPTVMLTDEEEDAAAAAAAAAESEAAAAGAAATEAVKGEVKD